jgi:cell division protein FtsI/penicillin-binding protein 2
MRQLAALGLSLSILAAIAYHARTGHSVAGSIGEVRSNPAVAAPAPELHLAAAPPLFSRVLTGADHGWHQLTNASAALGAMGSAGAARSAGSVVSAPLPADPALGISLDLGRAVLRDGHYEIDLDRRRRAVLTLDPTLQVAAETLLSRTRAPRAAVIVMATDGRILALAGRRTESPRGGKDGIADFRLATEVWAPAASIFKLVTATALLRAGVTPSQRVCFHGGLRSVMESNLTDSPRDNRCEDLRFAVSHSQNAIIAKLTHQHLSAEALTLAAHDLGVAGPLSDNGLARISGRLDLPASNGVDLAKAAAGFRGSHLSVLGGGLLANTLANRGIEATPTIVAAVIDGANTRDLPAGPQRRVVDAKIASAVASMMVGTCEDGSAAKSFRARENSLPKTIKVAGKTGTISGTEPFPMEYSWFVGFAPAEAPKISVSVLIGNTDNWWLKGHTVARELFETALVTKVAKVAKGSSSSDGAAAKTSAR